MTPPSPLRPEEKPSEQIKKLVHGYCGHFNDEYPAPTLYEKAIMEYLDSLPS